MAVMKALLSALAGVLALDLLWVGWLANPFYKARLGHLMADKVYWPAALAFYLLYPAGIWFFSVRPAGSGADALLRGALLGLLVYGVYNFTNMALLRGWGGLAAAVDMAWGAFMSSAVAWLAFRSAQRGG